MQQSSTNTYYFLKIKDQLTGCSSEIYMRKDKRFIYTHKDHTDLHKTIVAVNCFNGEYLPLVYVQRYFKGDEHEITSNQLCHGNNLQKDKPRQTTHFSARERVRELPKAGKGKKSI